MNWTSYTEAAGHCSLLSVISTLHMYTTGKLTERVSSSTLHSILEQSSSQHKFSSAVATRAAQRANALYNSDHVLSKVFMVA